VMRSVRDATPGMRLRIRLVDGAVAAVVADSDQLARERVASDHVD
jgi:hypothetical protein